MSTITHAVTVQNYSGEGNRFKIDGTKHPNLFLARGNTYEFTVSDTTMSGHAFKFSTTQDGTHGGGSEFTTGVTVTGTAGSGSAKVTLVCDANTPDTLYYYCGTSGHTGMAGSYAVIKTSGVILAAHTMDSFTTNVSIFANTIAREIPTKLESIATALKTHTNTEFGDLQTYVNTSLNSILSELNEMAGNIAKEQVEYEARYDTAFNTLQTNLGNYLATGSSYTQAQIQGLMFTGAVSSSNISYDSNGRLSSILSNGKLTWNITYDSNGYLDSFKENVTIGGVTYTKTYNVTVDSGTGRITVIEEV
tara:strand:- start:391 stop:1308 length:918 start_codon:yes stop_codon:yes gene_type:complete